MMGAITSDIIVSVHEGSSPKREVSFLDEHSGRIAALETQGAGFRTRCLCLDIETSHKEETHVNKIAAWRADTERQAIFQGIFSALEVETTLDDLVQGASFLLGHNVTSHDLPVLEKLYPSLALHALPVIDTLWLSPLAFPQNPYHSLVKDYKLVTGSSNDPLKDAQLSFRLFYDQFSAFEKLHRENPAELACHHFLLADVPGSDYDRLFMVIRGAGKPRAEEAREHFRALAHEKVCSTRLAHLLDEDLGQDDYRLPLAYVLAWLRTSGGNSVLPPWVLRQYPKTRQLIAELRDTACGRSECSYCC